MDIREFAQLHKLRWRLDECGDEIVPGKLGHFYQHNDGRIGLCVLDTPQVTRSVRFMKSRLRSLEALGLKAKQRGETEGTFLLPDGLASEVAPIARICQLAKIHKIGKPRGRAFPKAS